MTGGKSKCRAGAVLVYCKYVGVDAAGGDGFM